MSCHAFPELARYFGEITADRSEADEKIKGVKDRFIQLQYSVRSHIINVLRMNIWRNCRILHEIHTDFPSPVI